MVERADISFPLRPLALPVIELGDLAAEEFLMLTAFRRISTPVPATV